MTPRRKSTEAGRVPKAGTKTAKLATAAKARPSVADKPALSREGIVTAAMAILDREGYEALSMRRLGKELGVNPMAVYYHIPNKAALLDALVEVVMTEIDVTLDDASLSIEERLYNAAHFYRDALLSHPSLIHAVASRPPRTQAGLRPVEAILGIFLAGGFTPEDALASVDIIAAYVRGTVMREAPYWFELPESDVIDNLAGVSQLPELLSPEEFPNLTMVSSKTRFLGFEAEFDRGSRALVRGLLEMYGKKQEVKQDV